MSKKLRSGLEARIPGVSFFLRYILKIMTKKQNIFKIIKIISIEKALFEEWNKIQTCHIFERIKILLILSLENKWGCWISFQSTRPSTNVPNLQNRPVNFFCIATEFYSKLNRSCVTINLRIFTGLRNSWNRVDDHETCDVTPFWCITVSIDFCSLSIFEILFKIK